MKLKNIGRYLFLGVPPSAMINIMWHFTSITQCTLIERLAGWSLVWVFVSSLLWVTPKVVAYIGKFVKRPVKELEYV